MVNLPFLVYTWPLEGFTAGPANVGIPVIRRHRASGPPNGKKESINASAGHDQLVGMAGSRR